MIAMTMRRRRLQRCQCQCSDTGFDPQRRRRAVAASGRATTTGGGVLLLLLVLLGIASSHNTVDAFTSSWSSVAPSRWPTKAIRRTSHATAIRPVSSSSSSRYAASIIPGGGRGNLTAKNSTTSLDIATPTAPQAVPASSSSGFSQMGSADVVGPLVSVLGVVLFLMYTLLESGSFGTAFQSMDLAQKFTVISKVSWLPGSSSDAQVTVAVVMAFSAFAQALTGFGFAVVAVGALSSMPWLLHSELYEVVTPVAATLGALVGFILLTPYAFIPESEKTVDNPGLEWSEILSLLVPCTVLTPVGVQLHEVVDPVVGTRVLAALILSFVSYKLYPMVQEFFFGGESAGTAADDDVVAALSLSPSSSLSAVASDDATKTNSNTMDDDDAAVEETTPWIQSRLGAIVFGSLAGISGGAFDVQGPPLCVYGDAKGWTPAQFRNNILTVVAVNSALVVAIAEFKDGLNCFYYSYFCLTSIPGVLLGIVAGKYASERIDPILFKNLVLIMCLGLGLQLLTVS